MVGVGFFAGTILVRPFLPEDSKSDKGTSEVCSGEIKQNMSGVENPDEVEDIHNISWPFIITGLMTIAFSAGYFILGKIRKFKKKKFKYVLLCLVKNLAILPCEMPSHENPTKMYQRLAQHEDGFETIEVDDESRPPQNEDPDPQEYAGRRSLPSVAVIVAFIASFYFCSCGIERLFQSMAS